MRCSASAGLTEYVVEVLLIVILRATTLLHTQRGTQSCREVDSCLQVVPFSPAAGLLEWVEDTVPLGRYLIGEDRMSGAHRRYARKGELSFFESYTAMDKGHREGRPREAFDKVQYFHIMPANRRL